MRVFTFVWMAGLLAACGGDDEPGGPADARVDGATVDASIDAPIGMAMIGPEGGTIASADGIATLQIPAGAVAAPTAFTIDLVPQAMWPTEVANGNPVGPVYELGPEGTTFTTEAILTWTFATTPAGALTSGKPALLIGASLSASDVLEHHLSGTTSRQVGSGLVVETRLRHLSTQFLSKTFPVREPGTSTLWVPIGDTSIALGGGTHYVDVEWSATDLELRSADLNELKIGIIPIVTGPIMPVAAAEWSEPYATAKLLPEALTGWTSGPHNLSGGQIFEPSPMLKFTCTAVGTGTVAVTYYARFRPAINLGVSEDRWPEASLTTTPEQVNCVVREQKPEYTAEATTLGAPRIAPAAVPSTQTFNLTGSPANGLYGYNIIVQPGQTIRVCVTSNGSTGLNYYPRYPPGFTFVDGAPGCTDITNLDPSHPNEVLLKLSGTGTSVTVTVSVL